MATLQLDKAQANGTQGIIMQRHTRRIAVYMPDFQSL